MFFVSATEIQNLQVGNQAQNLFYIFTKHVVIYLDDLQLQIA